MLSASQEKIWKSTFFLKFSGSWITHCPWAQVVRSCPSGWPEPRLRRLSLWSKGKIRKTNLSWDFRSLVMTAGWAYPGRRWRTRTCWSSGWCILNWRGRWGSTPATLRYTPGGTPAGSSSPSQTPAEGWGGGSRSAAAQGDLILSSLFTPQHLKSFSF